MIDTLNGWKTIIVAGVGLLSMVLAMFGVIIDLNTQATITGTVIFLLMIAMRFTTNSPVGKTDPPAVATIRSIASDPSLTPGEVHLALSTVANQIVADKKAEIPPTSTEAP